MHYEKVEITDANYLKGTLIPFGTRVQILDVDRSSVKFQAAGHPPITLVYKYGRDTLPMDQYLDRAFPREDPHAKLASDGTKDRRHTEQTDQTRKLIQQGVVEAGMSKQEIVMAVGYPPAHRTPSLDAPMWTYWANRWATFEVYFEGDRVTRVNR